MNSTSFKIVTSHVTITQHISAELNWLIRVYATGRPHSCVMVSIHGNWSCLRRFKCNSYKNVASYQPQTTKISSTDALILL